MQMQPINPLGPLVAGAKEIRTNSGENFSDSLLSVHSKSYTVSTEQPEITTAQQDEDYATAHSPINDETTSPPKQPEKESNDHLESVAIAIQSSASDEKLIAAGMMPADGLAGPVATQIQGMITLLPGHNNATAALADIAVSNIMQQIVVETGYHNSESGLQQSTDLMQATANHIVPQRAAVVMQEAANRLVPQQVNFDSAPADSPILSQTMVGEVLPDQFLTTPPQDSETTLLQAHFKLPHSPAPTYSLPGRIISAVANAPYVSDQKAVGPIDLRYIELVQNSETGNLAPSTTQSNGTTTLTDSRFAEILGLTAAPGPETVQRLVPQKQRSWGPGVEAPVSDPAGQKTEARMVAQKISDQFMNDFSTDNPGKDILWAKPADSIAAASHTPGTGEPANLIHSMVPSQNTIPAAVLSQDGATARFTAGSGIFENRIIDQVIQQVSIRSNPKQSSISIRLHPEELGHLKMELVVNNETIKAHIHVQTQQVQDILEKNMARLREGFEQQGLVLDEIQVSVNSESKSGPGLFNDQRTPHARTQTANSTRTQESLDTISEETMVAPHRPDSIISLRI